MNKILKTLAIAASTVMIVGSLAGCGATETKTVYELSHYDGSNYQDGEERPDFNGDLWRRNDTDFWGGSDPFVLDNTARDGKYYRYMGQSVAVSADLSNWIFSGGVMNLPSGWRDFWAPEVIYDEDTELYYIFFSATFPDASTSGAYRKQETGEVSKTQNRSLYVGVCESPMGPFRLVDFTRKSHVGEENVRSINEDDYGYKASYVKYALFEPIAMNAACAKALYDRDLAGEKFMSNNIDPSPFVDPVSKKKYLLFNDERQPSPIMMIEMENWFKPKYDTLKVVARCGYYTVEDFDKAQKGETVETIAFENLDNKVNEGPHMYYRNGKYYLTYSLNGFTDPTYAVGQAVSDRVDGGFRKLTEAENGFMLSADNGGNVAVTGTGHHSFFHIGEKLFICYHRHATAGVGNGGRCIAIDEVKFVKITDKFGQPLDVMYVNGPTATPQPVVRENWEWGDISDRGTVKMVSGKLDANSSLDPLNDGLLSYNLKFNQEFLDRYVKETVILQDTTFEMRFDDYQTVRGFMVYNSKRKENIFFSLKDIEFECEEKGVPKTYYIKELKVDTQSCVVYDQFELMNGNYVITDVVYGASAYAEFDALKVKSIRFTVEVPKGQEKTGISEIAVVGKIN